MLLLCKTARKISLFTDWLFTTTTFVPWDILWAMVMFFIDQRDPYGECLLFSVLLHSTGQPVQQARSELVTVGTAKPVACVGILKKANIHQMGLSVIY